MYISLLHFQSWQNTTLFNTIICCWVNFHWYCHIWDTLQYNHQPSVWFSIYKLEPLIHNTILFTDGHFRKFNASFCCRGDQQVYVTSFRQGNFLVYFDDTLFYSPTTTEIDKMLNKLKELEIWRRSSWIQTLWTIGCSFHFSFFLGELVSDLEQV